MTDEQPIVAGRRRSKGSNAEARTEALNRLKSLRRGGRRSEGTGFQIKLEDPIYDTLSEDEYKALVAKRREEDPGFIVDDDGCGYGDEGQEEDWSQAFGPQSSDESESELEKRKKKKVEKTEKKEVKKPSPLSAAAALMGKQRLSNMFTSSVFKKNKDDKSKVLSSDSIVDDVIAEFAPDEADRERRRKVHSNLSSGLKSIAKVKIENPSIDVINLTARVESKSVSVNDKSLAISLDKSDNVDEKRSIEMSEIREVFGGEMGGDPVSPLRNSLIEESVEEEKLRNDGEVKVEPVLKKEEVYTLNAKLKEGKDPALSAAAGWQAVRSAGNGSNVCNSAVANPDFVMESDGSLPFYILDAHEEFYGANAGNIYLFGKVCRKI